jgi:tRNA(fMet)-specific endonuclease VapC
MTAGMQITSQHASVRYLLDTNTCIYVINTRPPAVLERFLAHEIDGLGISVITVSELYWGVCKSGSVRNQTALDRFLSPLTVIDFDQSAARKYGELRAHLDKQGTPIGLLDMQIAAHALSLGLTLVTNIVREFERVPGLKVENWV